MATPTSLDQGLPNSTSSALVLLDWNGTVMDDVARAAAAANLALAPFGLAELTQEQFQRGFTLPLRDWLAGLGVPAEHTDAAAGHWNREIEVWAPARASARATLQTLRERGVVTGVVTAAAPESVWADIHANDLDGLFDFVRADVEDKAACLRSLRDLGESALYVGDTAYDVASARAAGYVAVSIADGYQHADLLARSRPDHHIEDLAHLLTLCGLERVGERAGEQVVGRASGG